MQHKTLVVYDVRCTIYDLNASTLRAKLSSRKRQNAAYVRCWMYDVQHALTAVVRVVNRTS